MKRLLTVLAVLLLLFPSSARADDVPPFDIDPYNPPMPRNKQEGGYCTENWCIGPSDIVRNCGAAYCVWLTQTACITYGLGCGGQGGEGGGCDYSTECSLPLLSPYELPPGCSTIPCPPPTPQPSPTPPTPPPPSSCPDPQVIPGEINISGAKTWPDYPLVVGQDPDRHGVNLTFSASVEPTIYKFWTQEPEEACVPGPDSSGQYNCGGGTGHKVVTGFTCVEHTQTFTECIASARAEISLSKESRDWILNGELQTRYPGAYLHHPYFLFSGHTSCSWSSMQNHVQVADPGTWIMKVSGRTTGTPVSAPRMFSQSVGSFDVWLKEVMIVR